MEYASKAVGTAGLTTGIIGTALGALGGGASLLSNHIGPKNESDEFITRYDADMQHQLAAKDVEIAILKSEQYTDTKIVDVYERIMARVNADKNAQQEINTAQAVYNGTNTATLNCMQGQIAQLMSLTALRIPNTSVCPGWGSVNITPVTPTAAG